MGDFGLFHAVVEFWMGSRSRYDAAVENMRRGFEQLDREGILDKMREITRRQRLWLGENEFGEIAWHLAVVRAIIKPYSSCPNAVKTSIGIAGDYVAVQQFLDHAAVGSVVSTVRDCKVRLEGKAQFYDEDDQPRAAEDIYRAFRVPLKPSVGERLRRTPAIVIAFMSTSL